MKKIFSFEEAKSLLPVVRERTRAALDEIRALGIPLEGDGAGDADEELQEAAAQVLSSWAHDIQVLGIEVKGPWLIDFDSGAGYYCWRWPEESLEFFHGYSEGFSGRMRIQ